MGGKRAFFIINPCKDHRSLGTQHIDGSYSYSQQVKIQNNEETIIKNTKAVCEARNIYCCNSFKSLDEGLISDFQDIVNFLRQKDVGVAFYLPPYSELMYEYICSDEYYASIIDVEDWILKYANFNNIQTYGSYDPSNCNLMMSDLYDEYHIKEDKIRDTLWIRNKNIVNMWIK